MASRRGGAADAVFGGEFELVNPSAGLHVALAGFKNTLTQQLGHLFVEGAGLESVVGDGCVHVLNFTAKLNFEFIITEDILSKIQA